VAQKVAHRALRHRDLLSMATIRTRRRKDGSISHTVRIRLKHAGVIVHEESKTFDGRIHTRKALERWALKREDELTHPDVIRAAQVSHLTLGKAIARYVREYGSKDEWGRSSLTACAPPVG